MSIGTVLPVKTNTLKQLEFFNTYIKGSAVTTVPVEQYLKEKAKKELDNHS